MIIDGRKLFKPGDTLLIPGDLHIPYSNKGAIKLMLHAAKANKVKYFGSIGDLVELDYLSPHGDEAETSSVARDAKVLEAMMNDVKSSGLQPYLYIRGNHEAWYVESGSEEKYGLLEEALPALTQFKFTYSEATMLRVRDNLYLTHGHGLQGVGRKDPAGGVAACYPRMNILFGHTHKVATHCATLLDANGTTQTYKTWSIGAMVRHDYIDTKRVLRPNAHAHQLCFAVITFLDKQHFDVELGTYLNGGTELIFRGKLYK